MKAGKTYSRKCGPISDGPTPRGERPRVPPARLTGGEPSAQRDIDVHPADQAQPVRRYPGAPSQRGGVGCKPTPGVGAIGSSTRTSKKGLCPRDYMSPFSAMLKIDGPATIM